MIAEETKKQTWEEMGKREEAVEYAGRVGGRTEQVAKLGKRHHFSDASLRHVVLLTRPRGDFGWGGGLPPDMGIPVIFLSRQPTPSHVLTTSDTV